MKKLRKITSDEMVSVFLKAEFQSERWRNHLLTWLQQYQAPFSLLENPNLENEHENHLREQILGDFRGYKSNKALFATFPSEVEWWRVVLSKEELSQVRYMKYDYWERLSQETRLPTKAAENIKQGKVIFEQSNNGFIKAAEDFEKGKKFPEMILISTDDKSPLVVLEGHLRITSIFLSNKIPGELEVIIGFSPSMRGWTGY